MTTHAYPVSIAKGSATVRTRPIVQTLPPPESQDDAIETPAQWAFFNDRARWGDQARACKFNVAGLARQLGVGSRQLERRVKRDFACTPQQWLRELRMARAAELVRSGRPVKAIAEELGFPHVSSFCRQFKSHYGMTCSEYSEALEARLGA